jgi:hypothetical protein
VATKEETEALYALDISDVTWTRIGDFEDSVEIADLPEGGKAMRKASEPETVLRYTKAEWDAFVLGAKDGEFDLVAPEEEI